MVKGLNDLVSKFGEAYWDNLWAIKAIPRIFELVSGLKVYCPGFTSDVASDATLSSPY